PRAVGARHACERLFPAPHSSTMPRRGKCDAGPPDTSRNARAVQPPPKRTKIVATVGPASREPAMLRALFLAGVNVVRLNFSHGTHDEHGTIIADVRRIARELGVQVAVLQDLPGPKVRTGTFAGGAASVRLQDGAPFTLTTEQEPGDAQHVSVSYAGLARD